MIAKIDYLLDRVTMYRLVLYVLLGFLGLALALSYVKLLAFSPLALLASTVFLVVMCWAMNTVLAGVFAVPTNVESAFITALILALILDPAQSPGDYQFLGWAAILAMSSKFLLALNRKHVFNPAAIAVVITSFVLGESASWWVGTLDMLPLVLVGGWLVARKLRQEDVVIVCCAVALASSCVLALMQGSALRDRTDAARRRVAALFLRQHHAHRAADRAPHEKSTPGLCCPGRSDVLAAGAYRLLVLNTRAGISGGKRVLVPGKSEAESDAQAEQKSQAGAKRRRFCLQALRKAGIRSRTIHGIHAGSSSSR